MSIKLFVYKVAPTSQENKVATFLHFSLESSETALMAAPLSHPQLSYPLDVSSECRGVAKATGWIAGQLREVLRVPEEEHILEEEPAMLFALTDRVIAEDFRGCVIPRLNEITKLRPGGAVTNRGCVGFANQSFASIDQLKQAILRLEFLDERPRSDDVQALERVRDLCIHHLTTLDDVNQLHEAFSVRAGCVTHTSRVTEQLLWSKCHALQLRFSFTPAKKWWGFTVTRPKFTCEFHNATFHYNNNLIF